MGKPISEEQRARYLEYQRKNRKYYRENSYRYTEKIKRLAVERLGGKCCKCGIADIDVLCIDHINNDGHIERKQGIKGLMLQLEVTRISNVESRYQLLCANCNLKKEIARRKAARIIYERPDMENEDG